MKILITGGRGFIGAHTANAALEAGHEVLFWDRREGNDIMGDLSRMPKVDAIIHLAGAIGTLELFSDVEKAIELNVIGSTRMMEKALELDAAYVGILVPDVFPSIYCATKMASHRIGTALHHAKGLKVSHVRTFNAFGPGQGYGPGHPRKFMPTFSVAAWNNQPIPIWGDGENKIDLVKASDVGRMLVDACHYHDDDVFDAGSGTEVTVNDVAQVVLFETGSTAGIAYEPMRIGETPTNVAARGEGWDKLGWRPTVKHADLVEAINWYKGRPYGEEIQAGL